MQRVPGGTFFLAWVRTDALNGGCRPEECGKCPSFPFKEKRKVHKDGVVDGRCAARRVVTRRPQPRSQCSANPHLPLRRTSD